MFYLLLTNVASSEEDLLTSVCFDYGASGVVEDLAFEQTGNHFEPVTVQTPYHTLRVYFEEKPQVQCLEEIRRQFPQVQWEIHEEEDKDWLSEWKKGFEPFQLVDSVWVVPSWCERPSAAQTVIDMDPGLAFGTGTHETTQLMAELLWGLECRQGPLLDVGTGTGLLAILAEKLGFHQIEATEIDPTARQVACENVKMNHGQSIRVLDHQVGEVKGPYQVVIANIIDGVLLDLQSDLERVLAPGGHLLLSGILLEREQKFLETWSSQSHLQVVKKLQKGEWISLHLTDKNHH